MQITDIVKDSIVYPLRDWPNFVLLMVLIVSCIFIIPIPLLVGYTYRIITETIEGHDSLPDFHELAEMYVDGLKVILAMFVYCLVSFIVSTILMLIASAIGGTTFFVLLSQLFTILISIFSLFAVANMALHNDWAAVFDVKSIWELCYSIGLERILAWYCVLILMNLFAIVAGVLTILFFIVPVMILICLSIYKYRSLGLLVSCVEENMARNEPQNINSNEDLEEIGEENIKLITDNKENKKEDEKTNELISNDRKNGEYSEEIDDKN